MAVYVLHGPCSACDNGDTAMRYHNHQPSQMYTLTEIEQLAREYVKDCRIENSYDIPLSLSLFLTWLAKRERGKGEGR